MTTETFICENCSREHAGPPQKCERCEADGLCEACVGQLDHECVVAPEEIGASARAQQKRGKR